MLACAIGIAALLLGGYILRLHLRARRQRRFRRVTGEWWGKR